MQIRAKKEKKIIGSLVSLAQVTKLAAPERETEQTTI